MKFISLIIILFVLTGCDPNSGDTVDSTGSQTPSGKPTLVVKESFQSAVGLCRYIITDSETGVEYVVVATGQGVSITPRIGKTTVTVEATPK